ncbi:class I SAM-dependent methyltransferase [Pleomorphomonas sp. JP5]|uniref:class I SAM-dependent methyltransferase n=1 Tax=Pleomorphomonas sp. JP5 TaxID=2942998 RepID=UPI002042DE78|nr:class I SAM-dependent methyltransferase [Pleomorphomonas sp. JP5]MCM5557147.1 class I SAM-dependent methyltransferase [Pleomorphomonas sp. JP5]
MRHEDGSAGDADYGRIGQSYSSYRQPDPRIAAMIVEALGTAETVLNVGAGAGSYEPLDRKVTAVEPSASMRAQRPSHLAPAIDATAEHLPFADDSFDAAMASFTIHQWGDLEAGLREVRRVTRGPVVILTCDPREVEAFWLGDYAPKVLSTEAKRYPSFERVAEGLGTPIDRIAVPIPFDCRDGFNEAYFGRPEMLLEPAARLSCSAWSFITPDEANAAVARLAADLKSGAWDEKYGALRQQPAYVGSLYLLVSTGKVG